jgi:hypothetical protein
MVVVMPRSPDSAADGLLAGPTTANDWKSHGFVSRHSVKTKEATMSETSGPPPAPWILKIESDSDQPDEVRELSEPELQQELQSAGSRLSKMWVRQGDSAWHAAGVVLKKFQKLASEGIYVRRDGNVKGPFTAIKVIAILEEESDLDRTQAKVGLHADWIPASPLLRKLISLHAGRDQPSPPGGAAETTTARDGPTDAAASPFRPPSPIDQGRSRWTENTEPVRVTDEQASIELVLVAEPVQSQPSRPAASEPAVHRPLVSPTAAPVTMQSPRGPAPAAKQKSSERDPIVLWAAVLAIVAVLLVGGLVISVVNRNWSSAVANANSGAMLEGNSNGHDMPPVSASPPVVTEGMLYRPSFETTLGPADGGTLFAARIGRSNRMVLLGAAHLLGPATGLPRQLRGAEAVMYWNGLTVVDCVSGKWQQVSGQPLRLRTAEYPSISVHGDALAFEPDRRIGLEPLAVASTIPRQGDPVWLLAPARGSEALVHGGRWLGVEDDWYLYRLDNQGLDMVGTSGGALVNADHQVIGIHVAAGESDQGVISIASPIKPLIGELQ